MKEYLAGVLRALKGVKPDDNSRVKGLLIDCGDVRFLVDPRDHFVGAELRRKGAYQPDQLSDLLGQAPHGADVLIVGAHVGTLGIPVSKLHKKAFLVEANPDTFEFLRINCWLNALENVEIFNLAAGEADDFIRFVKNTHNSGGSKREPKNKENMYYYDDPETVEVKMVRLDDHIPSSDIKTILMDIEGSEYFAMQGMKRLLANCETLVVEFVPHHLTNVAGITLEQFLEPILANFQHVTIPEQGAKTATGDDIFPILKEMFDAGTTDEGLIFKRVS